MHLTPLKVFENLGEKKIDKASAEKFLITFVEEAEIEKDRLESLYYLKELGVKSVDFFKLLENILISDSNPQMRAYAAELIRELFCEKALIPMKWAIQHESNLDCLVSIIRGIIQMNNKIARLILLQEIKKLKRRDFIDDARDYSNIPFQKSLNACIRRKRIKKLSLNALGEILINYHTIKYLIETLYTIFFEWDEGCITQLDLSEIGWNVNVWRSKYAERLRDLSEIKCLSYLSRLKKLDLSHNKLSNIKDLTPFKELTELNLCYNHLDKVENIEYLKQLPNLMRLDISGNEIAKYLKKEDLPGIHVVRYHGLKPRFETTYMINRI